VAPKYIPSRSGDDHEDRFRDTELADDFRVIADLIERCSPRSEPALLLLTTCRNQMMTVNALFVDVRDIVGAATRPSLLGQAAHTIGRGDWTASEKSLSSVRALLSAARSKLDTWDEREQLSAIIDEAIATFGQVDRDRIRRLLGSSRERAYVPLIHRPTDFDVSVSTPHVVDLMKALRAHIQSLADVSAPVVSAVRALRLMASPPSDPEATLFGAADDAARNAWDGELATAQRKTISALVDGEWGGEAKADTHVVVLAGLGEFDLDVMADLESLASAMSSRITDVAADVRSDLQREFTANVVGPPMPAPFVVDLTPPLARDVSALHVERVPTTRLRAEPHVTVAALCVGVPETWYEADGDSAYRVAASKVDLLVDVVRRSIRQAATVGADILVLPEVFIPAAAIDDLHTLATKHDLIVIGGVDMHRERAGVVNRAVVVLPDARHEQRKQRPSVYEIRDNEFAADGVVRVFGDAESASSFGVLVCSDFLEQDVIAALERVGILFVCSRNPNPRVFEHMAIADSYRRYQYTVVVNAHPGGESEPATSEGTMAVGPKRDQPTISMQERVPLGRADEFAPHEAPSLALYELDLDAIAHRKNVRPDRGYLSPSHFARR
jgi:predicted amidohydrolase